jgi:hypothetical protein
MRNPFQRIRDFFRKPTMIDAPPSEWSAWHDPTAHARDFAFLAMTHHQLGHAKEAEAELQLLRERIKVPRWAQDAQAQGFLREAEELLAKPKSPNPRPSR